MPTSFAVDPRAKAAAKPEELTRAFTAQIPRAEFSPVYLLGMALVAACMIVLPLLYLALLAGMGYAIYYHATTNSDLLTGYSSIRRSSNPTRGTITLYIAPLVAGVVALAFMTKPFFAPRRRRPEPFTLERASNPVLYGYVDMLCTLMHAPRPKRIDVDEQVNASASFPGGWFSMLRGQVILTIGLPLAAGMTTRELTGVLAHEFGHFTQRLAMRLWWIISHINGWLVRVAYERDAWDDALERWQREESWVALFALLIKLLVWVTRLILKGLVIAAHAISCFMSRQMEYDADSWQCRVVGSRNFPPTFDRIALLGAAGSVTFGGMNDRWRERRLPDDIPGFIADTSLAFSPDVCTKILASEKDQKAKWWHTHPTRPQRESAAAALDAPGVFNYDAPATALFADFGSLCKQATYNHYKLVLGDEIQHATFVPTREIAAQSRQTVQGFDELEEFFLDPDMAVQVRPRLDSSLPRLGDGKAAIAELRDARKQMASTLTRAKTDYQRDHKSWQDELTAFRAKTAMSAGLKPDKEEVAAGLRTPEQAKAAAQSCSDATDARINAEDPFREAAERRITAALRLYQHPDAARKIPTAAADLKTAETMLSALGSLNLARPTMRLVMREISSAMRLLDHLASHNHDRKAIDKLEFLCRDLHRHVDSVRQSLVAEPYPFPHAAGQLTMASFVVGQTPPREYLVDVVQHARDTMERYWATRARVFMPLISMTLKLEKAIGFAPLKPPEPKPAEVAADAPSPTPARSARRT